jgi:hypothetical protein
LQLQPIVNLDENNISLDGSDGNTCGWPSVVLANSNHVNLGKAISKAGQGVTMIKGSNKAGEPFPPHFQFPSKAQSEGTKRVHAALSLAHAGRFCLIWTPGEEKIVGYCWEESKRRNGEH